MKIVIVGPGIMPIPPIGWGAVESLIWDYSEYLKKNGHDVLITNTQNLNEVLNQINNYKPDVVHIQYDNYYPLINHIKGPIKIITSHYGYITNKMSGGYMHIMNGFKNSDAYIFCLSPEIKGIYQKFGISDNRLIVQPNGADSNKFKYNENILYPDRSIYLAKVTDRKKQYLYQNIPNLYFAGNKDDNRFNFNSPQYLGEWKKEYLYEHLTDYNNLVLLSDGEAHPLVCCEALVAGLGLVLSEYAAANLDLNKPFITVIPDNKLNDVKYVEEKIKENRETCKKMRKEIREYGLNNFSWENIVKLYINNIEKLYKNNSF